MKEADRPVARQGIWLLVLMAMSVAPAVGYAAPPLPPADRLSSAIAAAPETRAAQARLQQAQSEARLLHLGPYEWTLSGAGARRNIDGEGRYHEWETALERPVRLPGKAALDRELGRLAIVRANAELQLAQRSARLEILAAWFTCVQAAERAALLDQDLAFLQRAFDTIATRRRGGDLAEYDEALAGAELAALRATATAARMTAIDASRLLATRLEVSNCEVPNWDAPVRVSGGHYVDAHLGEQNVTADPTVQASAGVVETASITAERVRRERWPDPTLGVTYGRERGGEEQLGGLSISIPLGFRRRTAEVAKAEAAAAVALADHDMVRADVRRQWLQVEAERRRTLEVWLALAAAESQQRRAAELSRRAFELGELSLSESLLVTRMALQARLAEREAALAAWHAVAVGEAYASTALAQPPDAD
ncbi:MAG: TolC family protein [Steroidobacteraceae bacterium]